MSNLFSKIKAFFQNLFHKQQATPSPAPLQPPVTAPAPVQATPLPPVVVAAPVEAVKPLPATPSAPAIDVSVTKESLAQWLQRTHPDLFLSSFGAYAMAMGPFIGQGMSYDDAFLAARSRNAGPNDSGVAQPTDWGVATPAEQLAPLTGKLLDDMIAMHGGHTVNGKGPGTDAHTEVVRELTEAGYSRNDIAGYINKYAPK